MAKRWDPFSWVCTAPQKNIILPKSWHQHHLTEVKLREEFGIWPSQGSGSIQGTMQVLSPSTGWFVWHCYFHFCEQRMEKLLAWVSWDHKGYGESNVGCTEQCPVLLVALNSLSLDLELSKQPLKTGKKSNLGPTEINWGKLGKARNLGLPEINQVPCSNHQGMFVCRVPVCLRNVCTENNAFLCSQKLYCIY